MNFLGDAVYANSILADYFGRWFVMNFCVAVFFVVCFLKHLIKRESSCVPFLILSPFAILPVFDALFQLQR